MIFDIIVMIVTLLLVIDGARKGMVYRIFSIAKFLIAIYLVPYFSFIFEKYLKDYPKIITYVVAFVVIFVVLGIIVSIIDKFIKSTNLNIINSIMGLLLGFVEAFVISLVFLIVLLFAKDYNPKLKNIVDSSYTAYYISLNSSKFNSLFPEVIENKLREFNIKNQKIKLNKEIFKKIKKEVLKDEN